MPGEVKLCTRVCPPIPPIRSHSRILNIFDLFTKFSLILTVMHMLAFLRNVSKGQSMRIKINNPAWMAYI